MSTTVNNTFNIEAGSADPDLRQIHKSAEQYNAKRTRQNGLQGTGEGVGGGGLFGR